jgi:hypothetical protein
MNIEQDIIDRAGKRMSDEIDFGVLTGMLCSLGWTRVVLKPMTSEQGRDIDEWVANNIKGPFETMGLVWVFEQPKDAVWFTLRWMS